MEATTQKPEVLVIVGATASGKSKLAMKVARIFNGEIIAADSRTIYKGMDIGTAKPSDNDRKEVKHWGLDLIEPGQTYSAAKYKKYALKKIDEIHERGGLPILVGGTGLYVDAVIFNFGFGMPSDKKSRAFLEKKSRKNLQQIILDNRYEMPKNYKNRNHLIRAIEREGLHASRRNRPPKKFLIFGLMPSDYILKQSINKRVDKFFSIAFTREIAGLVDRYGEEALKATGGIAYKTGLDYMREKIDLAQAIQRTKKEEWQYAKRQKTWARRNKYIQWYGNPEVALKELNRLLNK